MCAHPWQRPGASRCQAPPRPSSPAWMRHPPARPQRAWRRNATAAWWPRPRPPPWQSSWRRASRSLPWQPPAGVAPTPPRGL
eukprot:7888702-Alexandrium_andersonii.AAC.1